MIMSVCAYAHSNSRAPPKISWKVTSVIGEIKFGKIFVTITKYEPLAKILASEYFVIYSIKRYNTYDCVHLLRWLFSRKRTLMSLYSGV